MAQGVCVCVYERDRESKCVCFESPWLNAPSSCVPRLWCLTGIVRPRSGSRCVCVCACLSVCVCEKEKKPMA